MSSISERKPHSESRQAGLGHFDLSYAAEVAPLYQQIAAKALHLHELVLTRVALDGR